MKIFWYERAINDLKEIYEYYFIRSFSVALKFNKQVLKEIARLQKSPLIGQIDRTISDDEVEIRSLVVFNGLYKVLYAIRNDQIEIYRIWACRKNPVSIEINH